MIVLPDQKIINFNNQDMSEKIKKLFTCQNMKENNIDFFINTSVKGNFIFNYKFFIVIRDLNKKFNLLFLNH